MSIDAVIFDLDGVLADSEVVWNDAKRALTERSGGRWHPGAPRDMMGMSSPEWSRYIHEQLGVPLPPDEISDAVVADLERRYREHVPLLPGATDAVERLAACWPLGLASSSNRPIIDLVLERSGLRRFFSASVSSEEVPRGKPAPDVYLEAARRLGVGAERCAAIEDSANGLRSARAAGMRVVALPNPDYPPGDDALALADVILDSLDELLPKAVEAPGPTE